MRLQTFTPALLAWAALLAPCAAAGDIDKRTTMDADGHVTVVNVAGSVEVTGTDGNQLVLTGTLSEQATRLEFDASSSDVRIEVIYGKGDNGGRRWQHWGSRDMDSHLKLEVPRGVTLAVNTVSANIHVRDHAGAQEFESVSGDIHAALGNTYARVETVSGNIELTAGKRDTELNVDTVSGDVTLVEFRGDIDVSAVSGDVELRNAEVSRGSFESVSGDIDLAGRLRGGARLEIETISGDVSLRLEDGVDARFRIETRSGDIDSFFGNKAGRTTRGGRGEQLRFTVGGGSADVRISTLSGDVRNRGAGR